jgi:hypothetical protein
MDWDIPPKHSLSFPLHPPYLLPLLPRYPQVLHRKHTMLLPSYLLDPPPQVGWDTSEGPYLLISLLLGIRAQEPRRNREDKSRVKGEEEKGVTISGKMEGKGKEGRGKSLTYTLKAHKKQLY